MNDKLSASRRQFLYRVQIGKTSEWELILHVTSIYKNYHVCYGLDGIANQKEEAIMAKVSRKTYAEFTVPGLLFPESEIVEVRNRDVLKLTVPKAAYGLRFFDILITHVANKGKKPVKTESNPVNKSKYYDIGIKIYTADEVRAETEKEKSKLSKDAVRGREKMLKEMEQEKLKFALKCQPGGFVKLERGNLVLIVNGAKKEIVKIK